MSGVFPSQGKGFRARTTCPSWKFRAAPTLHPVLILAPSSSPCLQEKCLSRACQESLWLSVLS